MLSLVFTFLVGVLAGGITVFFVMKKNYNKIMAANAALMDAAKNVAAQAKNVVDQVKK